MQLNHWSKGAFERIYIQGLAGASGKVWLECRHGRLSLMADEMHETEATLLATLAAFVGVPTTLPGAAFFQAVREAAQRAPRPAATGYVPVAQRERSGDLAFGNIENAQPVHIEVDFREPPEIDDYLRQAPNTVVTRGHLPLGDYRINDGRVLVERKSTTDFGLSVQSARLFDQAQRIGFEDGVVGVCLIEGDLPAGNPEMYVSAITGALTCLSLVQGMSVFNTLDLRHSAYMLCKIAQHQRNGLGYELATRKSKPKQLLDAQRYVLEGINGVSPRLADALLTQFGSIRAVAAAEEAALRAVPGIGPKTAATLHAVLSGAAPTR